MSNLAIKYELLRMRSPMLRFSEHRSVILPHLRYFNTLEEPILVGDQSCIPPWFREYRYGLLTLAVGDVDGYELMIVERQRIGSGLFAVRSLFLDGGTHPVKSRYNILDYDVSFRDALNLRKGYTEELGDDYHVDVIPQEIADEDLLV